MLFSNSVSSSSKEPPSFIHFHFLGEFSLCDKTSKRTNFNRLTIEKTLYPRPRLPVGAATQLLQQTDGQKETRKHMHQRSLGTFSPRA